jgi:hypothetical protein
MRRIPSVPSEGDRAPSDCARPSYIERVRKTIRDDEAQISQNEASPDVGTPRTRPWTGSCGQLSILKPCQATNGSGHISSTNLTVTQCGSAQSLHRIRVDPISRVRPCPSEMIVWLGLIEIARIEAKPIGRS